MYKELLKGGFECKSRQNDLPHVALRNDSEGITEIVSDGGSIYLKKGDFLILRSDGCLMGASKDVFTRDYSTIVDFVGAKLKG